MSDCEQGPTHVDVQVVRRATSRADRHAPGRDHAEAERGVARSLDVQQRGRHVASERARAQPQRRAMDAIRLTAKTEGQSPERRAHASRAVVRSSWRELADLAGRASADDQCASLASATSRDGQTSDPAREPRRARPGRAEPGAGDQAGQTEPRRTRSVDDGTLLRRGRNASRFRFTRLAALDATWHCRRKPATRTGQTRVLELTSQLRPCDRARRGGLTPAS